MSSSVISANGESCAGLDAPSSAPHRRSAPARRTPSSRAGAPGPGTSRSSKITTRMTRFPTSGMWMLAFSPSWNWLANSFSRSSLAMPPGGRDVAGGQRRERRGVDVADLAAGGDQLAVLVDEEDDLGVRVPNQAVDDRLDLVELLFVHHHSGVNHREPPSNPAERWQTRMSAARQARSRPQATGSCQVSARRTVRSLVALACTGLTCISSRCPWDASGNTSRESSDRASGRGQGTRSGSVGDVSRACRSSRAQCPPVSAFSCFPFASSSRKALGPVGLIRRRTSSRRLVRDTYGRAGGLGKRARPRPGAARRRSGLPGRRVFPPRSGARGQRLGGSARRGRRIRRCARCGSNGTEPTRARSKKACWRPARARG